MSEPNDSGATNTPTGRCNKGKLIGPKPPLQPKHVCLSGRACSWMNLQAHYDLERAQATIAPTQVACAQTLGRRLQRARRRH